MLTGGVSAVQAMLAGCQVDLGILTILPVSPYFICKFGIYPASFKTSKKAGLHPNTAESLFEKACHGCLFQTGSSHLELNFSHLVKGETVCVKLHCVDMVQPILTHSCQH